VAATKGGTATYEIRISVKVPHETELRSGLTADAEVVLRTEADVLLIPVRSLREGRDRPVVLAWQDGAAVERLITTGSRDGTWVVVESGLSEGDVIVVESAGVAPE